MKKLILLLLCITICYACNKKDSIQPNNTKITTVSQYSGEGIYKFIPYPNTNIMDTTMVGDSLRFTYAGHYDSMYVASGNYYRKAYYYNIKCLTFDSSIVNPQYLTAQIFENQTHNIFWVKFKSNKLCMFTQVY